MKKNLKNLFKAMSRVVLIFSLCAFVISNAMAQGISLTPSTDRKFPTIFVDRTWPTPRVSHEVSVSNTSDQPTGNLTVSLSGTDAAYFSLYTSGTAPNNQVPSISIPGIAVGGTAIFRTTPHNFSDGIAAGTYTATVTVTDHNDILESFEVSYDVIPPKWMMVTGIVESMTGVGRIFLNGVEVTVDRKVEVGLFCGDQCRGSSLVNQIAPAGATPPLYNYAGLNPVGSNGDLITIKVYDHETGKEYQSEQTFTFVKDERFSSLASPSQILATSDEEDPIYDISLDPASNKDFGDLVVGYLAPPTAHAVTVSNTGDQPTGNLTVALSGTGAAAFTLSTTTIISIAVDGDANFTVVPKTGLVVGVYTATVTVSGGHSISKSFVVTFEVTAGSAPTYGISLNPSSNKEFISLLSIDTELEPGMVHTVTVSNTGDEATGDLTVALSGTGAAGFTLSTTTITSIAVDGTANFTVQPKVGLAVGVYTATVTVSGGHGISESFEVTFEVLLTKWIPDVSAFSTTMTGPLRVFIHNEPVLATGKVVVGAFCGTQCRGIKKVCLSVPPFDYAYMNIYGNTGDHITFKVYDYTTDTEYDADRDTIFVENGNIGIFAKPFVLYVPSEGPAPTYSILLDPATDKDFGEAMVGYSALEAHTVTVSNTGNQPTGDLTVALSGTGAVAFTLSTTTITSIAVEEDANFTVAPNTELEVGVYTATVTVSGDNAISESFEVTFEVTELPTYTITAIAGANGEISPEGEISVIEGESQTFTFAPNTGYHINQVLIDGVNNTAAVASGTYTFEDVSANHTIEITFAINTYTIQVSGGANGTITPSTNQTVDHGANQEFTFVPNTGYHINQVLIDGVNNPAAVASGTYTFEEVMANHTISVTFAINTYTIEVTVGENGTVTPSTNQTVNHGASRTFTFAANTNYHIDEVLIDGVNNPAAIESGTYTFTNVTENHTIEVTFALNNTYTIVVIAGANGTVTPSENQIVEIGESQTFTFEPNTGYYIDQVLIDGVNDPDAVEAGTYTFEDVEEDHTIEVIFAVYTYIIEVTAGENGTITPSTDQTVDHGSNQTFTFTPGTGYHIDQVLVDGVNNPAAVTSGTHTFVNVTAPHTIDVTFAINIYTIVVSAGDNGTVEPSEDQTIEHGSEVTFTFEPNTGYYIDQVLIDGVNDPAAVEAGSYTFENISQNHTFAVIFAIYTYTIEVIADENGTIDPSEDQTVEYGSDITFTFEPNIGYHIYEVLIDGENDPDAVESGTYTFEDVTEPHSIEVVFAINTYIIEVAAGDNGTITPAEDQIVDYGSDITFIIEPNTGYYIEDVLVDGVSNPDAIEAGSYTFEFVTEEHSIEVTFAIYTYTIEVSAGENGTIEPSEDQIVEYGSDMTFTFEPNTGYYIEEVLIDGVNDPDAVEAGTYTFENITENHTIHVTFAIYTYTIEVLAGDNGTITPSEDQIVDYGTDITFTFEPIIGHHIDEVLIDGENDLDAVEAGEYTFEYVTENHSIEVTFAINTYIIEVSAGDNGTITPSTDQTVNYGSDLTLTFAPAIGYHIDQVLVDGVNNLDAVESGTYTFEFVTEDHTIEVTFAINLYNITVTAGANGTIDPSEDQIVEYGSDMLFTVEPNTGYHIDQVLIDGVNDLDAVAAGEYTFEFITNDHSITVLFSPNKYTLTLDPTPTTVNPTQFTVTYDAPIGTLPVPAPRTGYIFAGWMIDETPIDATTIWNYASDEIAVAQWTPRTYTLHFNPGAGTVSPTSMIVTYDAELGELPVPEREGYTHTAWLINGMPITETTIWNFTINQTATATWSANTYTLTLDPSTGTVGIPSLQVTYNAIIGSLPNAVQANCNFLGWFIDTKQITTTTIWNYPSDQIAVAKFEYPIVATATGPGNISPEGTVNYLLGEDATYICTPYSGAHIVTVVIDGEDEFTGNNETTESFSYTFEDIDDYHTIQVTYAQNCYALNPANILGEGVSIVMNPADCVPHGSDVTFNFVANCYEIVQVTIDGVPQGAITTYTMNVVEPLPVIEIQTVQLQYTIMATPVMGTDPMGYITPSGLATINCGESATYQIFAAADHRVKRLLVNDISVPVPPSGIYNFNNVNSNNTIHVEFELKPKYIIEFGPSAAQQLGGSVFPTNDPGAEYLVFVDSGTLAYPFSIVPQLGYVIDKVYVDDLNIPAAVISGSYTFTNITSNHSIFATFKPIMLTITATSEPSNGINPNGEVLVPYGSSETFTAVPIVGYNLSAIYVDGAYHAGASASGTHTFNNVTENHTIAAYFVKKTYIITTSAGANGTITPGNPTVNHGDDITLTFAPQNGYKVNQVLINGIENPSAAIAGSFTFTNVTQNHNVEVTFTKMSYTINATYTVGGYLTPNGIELVYFGEHSEIYVFAPHEGYHVQAALIDGVNNAQAIEDGLYRFMDVDADHTIHIIFAPDNFTINATASQGGTINPEGIISVPTGSNKTFFFGANTGYELARVLINGINNEQAVMMGSYTFYDVIDNHSIIAQFDKKLYNVIYQPVTGALVSPVEGSTSPVEYGGTYKFKVDLEDNYSQSNIIVRVNEVIINPLEGIFIVNNIAIDQIISIYGVVLNKYEILAQAYTGGTITPAGIFVVTDGDDKTFEITPNAGYRISDVIVNGESVGAITTYTFNNIKENSTIRAYFSFGEGVDDNEATISVYSYGNVVTIVNEQLVPIKQVEIMDMHGRIVWTGFAPNTTTQILLNVAKGAYNVRIITETLQNLTTKIVIN